MSAGRPGGRSGSAGGAIRLSVNPASPARYMRTDSVLGVSDVSSRVSSLAVTQLYEPGKGG
jgi:hypothetical protein